MRHILAVIFGMTLASGAALATGDKQDFSELDKDGDGQLSQSEFQDASGMKDMNWSELDADGSGDVSRNEYNEAARIGEADKGTESTTEEGSMTEEEGTTSTE